MSYLIDTNVISELRKGPRCDPHVAAWFSAVNDEEVFLSVLTLGEIRRGVENLRRRDTAAAQALDDWLSGLAEEHGDRLLPVDLAIADAWGRLGAPDPVPVVDGLLAATASVHRLTLVTRNVQDVEGTGVPCLNPFEAAE